MIIRMLFLVLVLTVSVAMAQVPSKPAAPPADPDPLALTRVEIQDLKIADLELTKAQMEQALLQARYRELGQQIEQMKQSAHALEAGIIAARKLPAGARIDTQTMRIVPAPRTPEKPENPQKPKEAKDAPR
jgi:hypothetical protein